MTFLGQVRSGARVALLLLLAVTVQWANPQPALAWFGWLDKFSGPGDFVGALVETRLFCFGEDTGLADLRIQLSKAEMLTQRLQLGHPKAIETSDVGPQLREVRLAWLDVVTAVSEVQRRFPVIQKATFDAAIEVATYLPVGRQGQSTGSGGDASSPVQTDEAKADAETVQRSTEAAISEFLKKARPAILAAEREATNASRSQNGSGAFWSTCNPERRRRLSVELNVDAWWSLRPQENFADNQRVRLTTAMPSVTYRMFVDTDHDVLDIGAGAGAYWFSSKGFDAFGGAVVEPLRLSLHGPTAWHNKSLKDPRRWLSAVGIRGALLVVPRGFGATAFNGTGAKAARIPSELVTSVGFFVNTNSLFGGPR